MIMFWHIVFEKKFMYTSLTFTQEEQVKWSVLYKPDEIDPPGGAIFFYLYYNL